MFVIDFGVRNRHFQGCLLSVPHAVHARKHTVIQKLLVHLITHLLADDIQGRKGDEDRDELFYRGEKIGLKIDLQSGDVNAIQGELLAWRVVVWTREVLLDYVIVEPSQKLWYLDDLGGVVGLLGSTAHRKLYIGVGYMNVGLIYKLAVLVNTHFAYKDTYKEINKFNY